MASINKVILIGNAGRDPESRTFPDGGMVTNVSIATTETWKNKAGEKQERTEWHRLTFNGRLAEIAGQYIKKGSSIYVEGSIKTRKWEKDGVEKSAVEINVRELKLLSGRPDGAASAPAPAPRQAPRAADGAAIDDDIPF